MKLFQKIKSWGNYSTYGNLKKKKKSVKRAYSNTLGKRKWKPNHDWVKMLMKEDSNEVMDMTVFQVNP